MQPWSQAALRRAGQLMVALVFGLVLWVSLKGCGSGGGSPLSVLPEQTTSTTSSVIEELTSGEEGFSSVPAAPSYLTLSGTSYTQNFDGIGAGLPAGWTVRTGATDTNLGAEQTFNPSATSWADTAGRFKNFASGDGTLGAAATATEQSAATDRALGIRQTGTFGDPGAAFVFEIDDTAGLENFSLSLKAQMLSVQPRSTTWTIDYRVGDSGAFTSLGTYADPGVFGSTDLGPFALSDSVNNQCDPVYIRIAALSASSGSGNRDSFGIDDVELTYSGAGTPVFCGGDPTPAPSPSPTPSTSCGTSFTPIYEIQGTGATAAITGTVTTEGIVVGDYEGPAPNLRGFFIQDPTGDNNPETSDGIFVFNGNNNDVNLGERVRVIGSAGEFQFQTQISNVSSIEVCSSGNTIAPVAVTLPFPADPFPADPETDFPERYEGMLVTFPQDLFVTDLFRLGRFGQVTLSSGDRLYQPTNVALPPAAEVQEANERNRIIIDDTQQTQNPDPIKFPNPVPPGLTAMQTLRGGDIVRNVTGVLNYTWGGNAASPNAYRVRAVEPGFERANGMASFAPGNPRPTAPPSVGGSLKVVTFNVLNYFTTFGSRGADNATEFTRQRNKIIEALALMDGDIVGLIEIENNGYGSGSAIQNLVDGLNARMGAGTYTFIDPGTPSLGGDEITNGFIYKPATVEIAPGTVPAALTTGELQQGAGRLHRPPFAVTFRQLSTGGIFTVVNNHLKSKGSLSTCTPTVDPSQGNCNDNRTQAAREILAWVATNPTGTNDPDYMITGDINAYAKEDPIRELESGGFINLITSPTSYSFSFNGFWGSLDHSLANSSLNGQVSGAAKWAINADEPPVLDYNTNFKSAGQVISLYAPDAFRSSDHDPVIVGLNLTGSGPTDPVAPVVVSTSPANGAIGVPRDTQIRLTFDQPIQKGTGTIVLRRRVLPLLDTRTTDIATSPRVAIDGNTFILTVSGRQTLLNRLTLYDFTFPSGGVTSLSGVPLANPVSFSFRTRFD